ncbi:Protein xmas [Anthophora plagiata]
MECKEKFQKDIISSEHEASRTYTFSKPNIINPPTSINFGFGSEQVSDASVIEKDAFTFTMPTIVSQVSNEDVSDFQSNMCEKQYKPKISRNSYKPDVNVFAHAIKDTVMFDQLKKNSRSQAVKVNPENSITCTNVPQLLLTKATAKEYFTQFGNLVKITIRRKKQIITVIYATKEEASVACKNSGEYLGEKFHVEWTKSCASPKSPTKKKDLQKNIVSQIVSNFFKSSDDEIKSEINSMINLEYNLNNRHNYDGTLTKKPKALQSKNMSKSAIKVEKASVKSEKHKSDSQISDLLPNATIEELQNIIQQPAYTSEDKYKVLEARDRLMRMKQVKLHTLAAAKVMIGTCPDMCPEKERLMRESKRQVASYELLETNEYKINHMIAIKQYSRSSADQEEPMAHELRPVKSLKMTMSYLLHEIADLCDQQGINLGEWYHFLWDRTRSIRKDITQQELCCIDSVKLVEQCARFHIVCSERLCAEEPSIFDKRINSDNLTKCLQSLKYMYHDLRVKGINCKNESEFRAYIILLNLNNGNFMWDLQRLPKYIQKSSEVQFALEVYSALESNNYYKFFKLVSKTTYLNACILLRYFNQVRLKALSVLVKAYCRTASTAYPLYELIDILGFEDENEAIYFCEQVGLNVSKDGLHILLNRQNFTIPVLNIKQNRACNLIESKRNVQNVSIGECIAGGKMPEKTYKFHTPHSSFDSHGYLMPDSINAEDQTKYTISTPSDPYEFIDENVAKTEQSVTTSEEIRNNENITVTEYTNASKSVSTTEADTNTTVKSDVNVSSISESRSRTNEFQTNANASLKSKTKNQKDSKMFNFTQKQQPNESPLYNTFNVTSTVSRTSNIFSKQSELQSNNSTSLFSTPANKNIFSGTVQGNAFSKSVAPTIFSNTYSSTQTAPISSNITNSGITTTKDTLKEKQNYHMYITEVKKQDSKEEEAEKLKLEEEEFLKKMQQNNETAEEILNTLQTEVIQAYCSTIVKEEIDRIHSCNTISEDINNEILNDVTCEICDDVLKEEIVNTKKLYEMSMKIKNRVVIKCFNIWKCNTLKKKQQRKMLENTPVWLQKRSSEECAKLLYTKEQGLVIECMLKKPDDEPKVIKPYSEFLAPIEIIIYAGIKENLKLLDSNVHSNYYWKLVISWPNLHNKAHLWHHKKIMNQYLYPDDYTLDSVVKLYQPNQIETLHICIRHFEGLISDHNLTGSDALLFIADASEEIKFVVKRLTKNVLSRDKLTPVPLVFIILGDSKCERAMYSEVVSCLEKLLTSGYLSMYTIMHEKEFNEKTILNLTQSAILWLSINKSPKNPLEMDYLKNIYDTCLTEELWLRIFDDSSHNEKLQYALEEPNFIIDLHNEAVTHLIDIILDAESFMYTKFAPEFKKFIKDQHTMPCGYEYFDDIWKNEDYKAKLETVMSSFKLPEWKYTWPITHSDTLRQNITAYCQEALFSFDSDKISCNILSSLFFTTGVSNVSNFIDVLLHVIKKKIYLLEEDLKVIYNKNHLKHFRTLPWWLKSNLLAEYKIPARKHRIEDTEKENKIRNVIEPVVKKRKLCKSEENDFAFERLAMFYENTQSQVMEVHCISRKIENRLKEHQQQSFSFEKKLKSALFGNEEFT